MIGIIDYGMGNLLSVKNILDHLGEANFLCHTPGELSQADRIILPGIGGFPDCIRALHQIGFVTALNESVLVQKKPIMGICLGMQVMASYGYEFEKVEGLGWFDAQVVNINTASDQVKVPNVGWEEIHVNRKSPLFRRLPQKSDFYLVHSFYMRFEDANASEIDAFYEIGDTRITAAVRKGNIFATQFHPEKSSDLGMTVLENFIDWEPQ